MRRAARLAGFVTAPDPWLPPPTPRASRWAPPAPRAPAWAPPEPPEPPGAARQRSAWPPPEAPTNLAAPPDPGTRVVAAADYVAPRPRQTRTVPKALACAILSAVVPGLGQACQRRWRAAVLFFLPVAAALAVAAWALLAHDRATLVDWGASSRVLRSLFVAGLLWALLCAISAGDAARAGWPRGSGARTGKVAGAVTVLVVMVAALFPGLAGAWTAIHQDTHPRPGVRRHRSRLGGAAEPARRPRHHHDRRPDDGRAALVRRRVQHRAPRPSTTATTAAPTTAPPTAPQPRPGAGRSPCSGVTPGLGAGTCAPTR